MLTEQFLNSCLTIVLNKKIDDKAILYATKNIGEIISFYRKKEKSEIPVAVKNKLDCLEELCKMRFDGISPDNALDSLSEGERFKHLFDFLELKLEEEVPDQILADNIDQIRLRLKSTEVFSNYDELSRYIESVKNGSYNSIKDLTDEYEKFVKGMYANLMKIKRTEDVEKSSTFDLCDDNYESVIELIKKKYSRDNTIPCGFDIFDNNILNGGFEKSRLYIFAGGTSSGKSTIMTNFIEKGCLKIANDLDKKDEPGVYLYITLENQVDETFMRIYQSMFEKTTVDMLKDLSEKSSTEIKDLVSSKLIKNVKRPIVFKYYPKFSLTPIDISMIIDEVEASKGVPVKIVYLDYLDLLRADQTLGKNYDLYRLELSHITSALKDIAVSYNIPIVTLSQLGREVYQKNPDSKELNMGMMSEAIKKVEHADFICLMSKDKTSEDIVFMNVAKNRGGRANVSLEFTVNFKMYRFISATEVMTREKPNAIQDHLILFGDLPGMNGF